MIGAIAGDVIGSAYEANAVKTTNFQLFPPGACFTDDTVLTKLNTPQVFSVRADRAVFLALRSAGASGSWTA